MKEPLAERCVDCPKGFFCVNDKSQDPEPCPQGYYCPTGTGFDWKPCPKGSYGDTTGLANETSRFSIQLTLILEASVAQSRYKRGFVHSFLGNLRKTCGFIFSANSWILLAFRLAPGKVIKFLNN